MTDVPPSHDGWPTPETSPTSADLEGVENFCSDEARKSATPPRDKGVGELSVVVLGLGGRRITVPAGAPNRSLAIFADEQHGRVACRQLLAVGWTPSMIRTALATGRFRRIHRGVVAVGHRAAVPLGAQTSALLAIGSDAVLCGRSVLALHGLLADKPERAVDVTTRSGRRPSSRLGVAMHRCTGIEHDRIRSVQGLPTTSVERALLDAAETLAPRELEQATADPFGRHLTSRTKIRELVEQHGNGRPGAARLAALADPTRPAALTASQAAELALKCIREAGLPEPETEVEMFGFRADFFFREAGVAFEVDSHSWHGLVRENFERDRRKDRVFHQNGIPTVRATAEALQNTPIAVMTDLGMTIADSLARKRAA